MSKKMKDALFILCCVMFVVCIIADIVSIIHSVVFWLQHTYMTRGQLWLDPGNYVWAKGISWAGTFIFLHLMDRASK